jgi:hypothetical protein
VRLAAAKVKWATEIPAPGASIGRRSHPTRAAGPTPKRLSHRSQLGCTGSSRKWLFQPVVNVGPPSWLAMIGDAAGQSQWGEAHAAPVTRRRAASFAFRWTPARAIKLCKNCAGSYWLDNAKRAFPPAESLVPRLIVHTALELYRSTAIFASTRRAWQSRLAGLADRWPRGTAHPRAESLAPPRRGPRLLPIGQ